HAARAWAALRLRPAALGGGNGGMVHGDGGLNCRVLALAALFFIGACATTAPERAPEAAAGSGASPVPAERRGLGAAGEALLVRAAGERRGGDYRAAAATLERALRIEPGAPSLWLELARVRLLEGDFGQAEQLARKAGSLAPPRSAAALE